MNVHLVPTESDLQAALDKAQPSDEIRIAAGTVLEGTFTLPQKTGMAPIVVRVDVDDDQLPPSGARITPDYSPLLPKLVSPDGKPVLQTAPQSRGYTLLGLELTVRPDVASSAITIVALGSKDQDSDDQVPTDLRFDRCYIHGNPAQNVRRGIALNAKHTDIVGCYLADFHHEVGVEGEAQAIAGWNGPGPFLIENCYLEAGDVNVLFGGADPKIDDLVPSDITFRRNLCRKPLSWRKGDPAYAGHDWRVKNLFELKNAQQVVVEGNVFEHNWINGDQDGFAIVFTPRNQDGAALWSVVQEVTFRNNLVRHAGAGINVLGRDDPDHPSQPTKHITIANNLFLDIDGVAWGSNGKAAKGRWLQIGGYAGDVEGGDYAGEYTVDHNTAFPSKAIVFAYGDPTHGFVFTNNIAPHNLCDGDNDCGLTGNGHDPGNGALEACFPGRTVRWNVVVGPDIVTGTDLKEYPAGNFYPPSLDDVGFVGGGDFRLAASSPYKGQGEDGTDPGCNIDELGAAGVVLTCA